VLERNGLTAADLDMFVSHKATSPDQSVGPTEKLASPKRRSFHQHRAIRQQNGGTIPLALNDACARALKRGARLRHRSARAFTVGRAFELGFLEKRRGRQRRNMNRCVLLSPANAAGPGAPAGDFAAVVHLDSEQAAIGGAEA